MNMFLKLQSKTDGNILRSSRAKGPLNALLDRTHDLKTSKALQFSCILACSDDHVGKKKKKVNAQKSHCPN